MLSINVPPVTIAQVYNDTTIPIPNPPKSGPKKKETRKQCLEGAAAWRRNSLLMGVASAEADRQWGRQVDRCLRTTPAPLPRVATFIPAITTPPKPPTPIGTGTRLVMFVPLGQMFNPITAIGDFLSRQTQPKPDPMAKYNACILKGQQQRVANGQRTDDRVVKRGCNKHLSPAPAPKK